MLDELIKFEIRKLYKKLLETQSDRIIYSWPLCADYDIALAGSTIDQISLLSDGRIIFIYNMDEENRYDELEHFSNYELLQFYNNLAYAMEQENDAEC